MARSQIIKELVNEEISLTVALKRLLVLANDIEDAGLKCWAEKELSGYLVNDDLPGYRILTSSSFTYCGIVGQNLQMKNASLDLGLLSSETRNDVLRSKVTESISSIEKIAREKQGEIIIDRSYLAREIFENSGGYSGIQCTSISQRFTSSQFEKILQIVSSKILEILLKLEKSFGNLDSLDICTEKISEKNFKTLKQDINLIIFEDKSFYNNGKIKLSKSQIVKGDENRTTSSQEKISVKNSNVGHGSNTINKTTEIDTNLNVSNQDESKESRLSKIFKKRRKNG